MRVRFLRFLTVASLAAGVAGMAVATPAPSRAIHRPDVVNDRLPARTDAAEARLSAARTAGRLSVADAKRIGARIHWIRTSSARDVKRQGLLSAGENASYIRALKDVEAQMP